MEMIMAAIRLKGDSETIKRTAEKRLEEFILSSKRLIAERCIADMAAAAVARQPTGVALDSAAVARAAWDLTEAVANEWECRFRERSAEEWKQEWKQRHIPGTRP